jgi:cyclopropane fatty-acyl-phospholipid synthase-like methyltransferase
MTDKWFVQSGVLDMNAALHVFDVFLRDLWPHAAEVVRTGERPFNFYEFVYSDPELAHDFQQLMVGNANVAGAEVLKKLAVPSGAARLLDVGGGHGVFSVMLAQAHAQLEATILDDEVALQTAKQHISKNNLNGRVHLMPGDMWQMAWGEPYDLILLFNMVHHFDADINRKLLQRAHAALKPGGQVAVFDQIEGSVFGGASNGIVQVVAFMYYLFADGRIYSADELIGLLTDTGFKQSQVTKLRQAPGSSLITAVKG